MARHFVWGILCALLWPLGEAAAGSLKSSRFNGGEYVMVSEVAAFYNLGADRSQDQEIASYRAAHAQLSCQAERREIGLNGVTHWLSAPVLNERGRLWFSALDVLKTIDPVMRSARQKTPGTVRTVVVDAGHGGNDFGTHGQRSVEKTLTLDMAKRVRALLEAAGFRVVMTRTSDRAVSLEDRCEIAADKNADLLVSIHCNSGGTAQGVETFCATPAGAVSTSSSFNGWPRAAKEESTPGNRFDTQNIFLAHSIQRRLVAETDAVDRGVRRARFVVVRDAPCPAVLVETGFLSNATEEKKLLSPEYRDRVAKAVVAGIVEYRAAIERK